MFGNVVLPKHEHMRPILDEYVGWQVENDVKEKKEKLSEKKMWKENIIIFLW